MSSQGGGSTTPAPARSPVEREESPVPSERLEQVLKVAQDLERENSRLLAALAEAERRGDLLEADLRRLNSRDDGPLQQVREELERTNRAKLLAEARAEQLTSLAKAEVRASDVLRQEVGWMEAELVIAREKVETLSRAAAEAAAHRVSDQRETDERLSRTLRHLQQRKRATGATADASAALATVEHAQGLARSLGTELGRHAEKGKLDGLQTALATAARLLAGAAKAPAHMAVEQSQQEGAATRAGAAEAQALDLTARMSKQPWVAGEAGAWRISRDAPVGPAIYGPYASLEPGCYCATFDVDGFQIGDGLPHAFSLDAVMSSGQNWAAELLATAEQSQSKPASITFSVPSNRHHDTVEVRLHHLGVADLRVRTVALHRVGE